MSEEHKKLIKLHDECYSNTVRKDEELRGLKAERDGLSVQLVEWEKMHTAFELSQKQEHDRMLDDVCPVLKTPSEMTLIHPYS